MKLEELMVRPPLLEGGRLKVYETLIPLLLISEDAGDSSSADIERTDFYRTEPFVGNGGGRWFRELYNSVKSLIVSTNILKRMKEIGIKPDGMARVELAAKTAAKNVNALMSNPRATAYKIPVWTFDKPSTPKIKRWNEGFAHEFKLELAKLSEQQIVD